MEIDAVQIIAGFLGGDGEARLVDEALQIGRRERKGMAEILDAERREVVGGQGLQRELRRAAGDGEPPLLAVPLQLDIGAFGQLAHDVVEHMGGHGGGAFALGARGHGLHDLHVEIGRGQGQLVVLRGEEHVGQDGDRVAPLHHARHMGKCLGEGWFVDREPHDGTIPRKVTPSPVHQARPKRFLAPVRPR
jgi:hypothetical protein